MIFADRIKTCHMEYSIFFEESAIEDIILVQQQIGTLQLPSGEIVACDPFFAYNPQPFSRKVKPGAYPVEICLASTQPDDYKVALARILFSKNAVTSWERADLKSNNAIPIFKYPVDNALGCFMDVETAKLFTDICNRFYKKHPFGNYYEDVLEAQFQQVANSPDEDGNWCNHTPDPNSQLNIIMFGSGYGNGIYPTYWGLDKEGEVVCLLTDFELFEEDED